MIVIPDMPLSRGEVALLLSTPDYRMPESTLRDAVTENVQRENMTPIEEALAFQALQAQGDRKTEIAKSINKSAAYVANRERLLQLPPDVQEMIAKGDLSPAQALPLIRFAAFPNVVSAAAAYILEKGISSHDLESHKGLPPTMRMQLDDNKHIKILHRWETAFDWQTICACCPFQAFHTDGTDPICLKRDHFDDLVAAAVKEMRREADAAQARLQEEARHLAVRAKENLAHPGAPDKDAKDHVLRCRDMGHDKYEYIGSQKDCPAGCTRDCPCRAVALSWDDKTLTKICLDPNRHRALKSKETREKKAALKLEFEEYRKQLRKMVVAWDGALERRALAVMAWSTIYNIPAAVRRELSQRTKDGELAKLLAQNIHEVKERVAWSVLTGCDQSDLLFLLAEGLMQCELKHVFETNYGKPDKTRYLLEGVQDLSEVVEQTCVEDEIADE